MWDLPISVLLAALTAGKLIFLFLCWLGWRAIRAQGAANPSRMIGLTGKALTAVQPEGRVMVQGEYWWARARTEIAAGENIRVVGIDGLTLAVEPSPDKAVIPRPVSAVVEAEIR